MGTGKRRKCNYDDPIRWVTRYAVLPAIAVLKGFDRHLPVTDPFRSGTVPGAQAPVPCQRLCWITSRNREGRLFERQRLRRTAGLGQWFRRRRFHVEQG